MRVDKIGPEITIPAPRTDGEAFIEPGLSLKKSPRWVRFHRRRGLPSGHHQVQPLIQSGGVLGVRRARGTKSC